jgi:hypothetical protein
MDNLIESVQKIIQITQNVTSLGTSFHTGANIPTSKLATAFGIESDIQLNSLEDIKNLIGEVR